MNTQRAVIGLVAAAAGAYFLLRPRQAYASELPAIPRGAPVDPYGPPLPPSYIGPGTYTDPLEDMTMPKGIRNHNPMNLRFYSTINWQGQIGADADGYARFDTVEQGIRAGVKNLMNGYFAKGISSPQAIISKYAPSHENPTDSYIRFLSEWMGIPANQHIEPTFTNMVRLTKGIIRFENGSQPYMDSTIVAGVNAGMTT